MGGIFQFFFFLGMGLIFLPPFRKILHKKINRQITWWQYGITLILLYGIVIASFMLNPAESIYKSEKHYAKLNEIYDANLAQWPTEYESKFVDTKYGKIHVIISGPEEGYPVVLVNASALSAWSWRFNVGELNKKYRTYAIDNIGEGGKNQMKQRGLIPKNGEEIAELYTDLTQKLGIKKSYVVGASVGGYISTNYALYAPERVEKLVLLGSMGYGATMRTIITMTLAQGFPFKVVQDATFRWAFGDDKVLNDAYGEWFRVYMKGLVPSPIMPHSFTPEMLKNLSVPTLAYFGMNDGVIGDAQDAKALAENIPNVAIKVVDSGHIIGIELADEVNPAMMQFFEE